MKASISEAAQSDVAAPAVRPASEGCCINACPLWAGHHIGRAFQSDPVTTGHSVSVSGSGGCPRLGVTCEGVFYCPRLVRGDAR